MNHVIGKADQRRIPDLILENFSGATDRRQRTFHFMGQEADVIFQPRTLLQSTTHGRNGIGQSADLIVATKCRRRRTLIIGHRLRIASQAIDPTAEPPGQQPPQQQATKQGRTAIQQQMPFRPLHKRLDGTPRFAQADDPDQTAAVADRGGHIHDRGGRVLWVRAGSPCPVATLQGQMHIIPAGEVLTFILAPGIEQHGTGGTSDIDVGMDTVFFQAPDIRIRCTPGITIQGLAQ